MQHISSTRVSFDQVDEHVKGLKIHAMISSDLVADETEALDIPLGQATDEQLLAEIARRKLDVHANITQVLINSNICLTLMQEMVKSVYDFDAKPLGHGASAEGVVLK
jgi:hypothetical protein